MKTILSRILRAILRELGDEWGPRQGRVVPRGVNMALAYGESVRLLDLPDLLLCFRDDPRQPNPQDPHDSFKRLDAGVLLSSFEESVEYTVGIAVLDDLAKSDERRVRGFLTEERATREGRSGEARRVRSAETFSSLLTRRASPDRPSPVARRCSTCSSSLFRRTTR